MNESAECLICNRGLYADELGRYACNPCTDRIDEHLRALAGSNGLYARLSAQLALRAGNGWPGGLR
ncbi:hypothetical protein OOK13_07250 [Streptomyces sp. NBC_00378]|uniref:hypothetical protein n=1 Tax=unclassified Streptomyces TaxID=2593676 RepID=UPI0022546FD4|nr:MULTISPECIES: hypothetical protein [unclassified Streptomyces]MCX5108323.1 hypothetical protein [Streptomyces sp. NBC_00378]